MGGFSLWHWIVVLVIVVVIFGTKKLRNAGGDLGAALRDFKKGLHGSDDEAQPQLKADPPATNPAGTETKRENAQQ